MNRESWGHKERPKATCIVHPEQTEPLGLKADINEGNLNVKASNA